MPILAQGASIDLAVNGDSTLTLQSPAGGFVTVENPVGTVIWRGGQSSRQIDVKSGTVRITANTRDVDYALNTDPLNGIPVLYDPLTGQMSANGSPVSGAGKVSIVAKGAQPGRAVEDAVLTNGSNQISSATASFSPSDVGMRFTVCDPNNFANRLNGTIVSVQSATVATMTATAGFAATGCGLAVGPDCADAIDAAVSSLSVSSRVPIMHVPLGVYLTSRVFELPDGVSIEGQGADYGLSTQPIGAGSALLLAASQGAGSTFVSFGSGTNAFVSGQTRSRMVDIGIDACNNADISVQARCRRGRIVESQIWRGRTETLRIFGQNQEVWDSVIGAQNVGNVVGVRTSDVKLLRNQMRQGGQNALTPALGHQIYVRMDGQNNVLIEGNHFWSGFNAVISSAWQGCNVMIHTPSGTAIPAFLATIVGNTFDSTYGPQIAIRNEGTSRLSQIDIASNQFFQTTGFPDATFPIVSIEPISGSIRSISFAGNTGNGAINNWTAMLAQTALHGGSVAGVLSHVSATGNSIQNCNALWAGFTPGAHSGNIISANFGTAELRGDNAGRSSFNGTGAQTAFVIAHGLAAAPASVTVTPGTTAASGAFAVTSDATNITVTYASAPASGTNNVVLNWAAKV
jgi:hypothetical protein